MKNATDGRLLAVNENNGHDQSRLTFAEMAAPNHGRSDGAQRPDGLSWYMSQVLPGGGSMKWMMCSVAMLVAIVLPVVAGAQSGTTAKGDKMDNMEMKDAAYTGCIEVGSTAGTFTLTHVADDHMAKDAMKKDTMKKDTMKSDTMGKDTMKNDTMGKDTMATTLTLTSASVDLSKHLGHKVSVTGSAAHGKMDAMGKDTMAKDGMAKDASAFTVKSLKMVAASCS